MKVKFADRIYEVLFTKELAGLTMYAVEDEPNHIDWLINVEVVDAEKKELKKIEQKSVDTVEPKFKAGDRVIGIVSGIQYYITEVRDDYYCTESGCIIMFNAQNNFELYKQKPAWSKKDEEYLDDIIRTLRNFVATGGSEAKRYTEEEINWLKDKVLPKQEWSEQDKEMLQDIIDAIPDNYAASDYHEMVDWLKSLRPQNRWKPSELQLECLSDAIEHYHTLNYPATKLVELLEQLKKL